MLASLNIWIIVLIEELVIIASSENPKKSKSPTDNLKSRDASATKKRVHVGGLVSHCSLVPAVIEQEGHGQQDEDSLLRPS